jgi:hypothetical protein
MTAPDIFTQDTLRSELADLSREVWQACACERQPMAEDEGAAPQVACGCLHIGCSPLESRNGSQRCARWTREYITGDGVSRQNVQHRYEYVFDTNKGMQTL